MLKAVHFPDCRVGRLSRKVTFTAFFVSEQVGRNLLFLQS